MFEIIEKEKVIEEKLIVKLSDMKPLEIGRIIDEGHMDNGDTVMRTASNTSFEVMNLSKPGECWLTKIDLDIWVMDPSQSLEIRLFNAGQGA